MRGQSKTKEQLKNELKKPPHRIIEQDRSEDRREQIDKAAGENENYYRTLVENLPQKIFLKDKNSVYLSCNENYSRDLKIRADEITGKTDYDFYPKELAGKYQADDKRIMASGKTEDIEERYIQDGKEVIVHTVKTPIRDEKGKLIGILGIFWDITKRKRAEEELRKYREQLQEMVEKRTAELRMVNEQLQEEITEHRRTEEVLRESEERYWLLVENADETIFVAQDGMLKFVNRKATEITGYSKEELTSKPFVEFIHPDDREMVLDRHLKQFQGKELPSAYPFRIISKDGNVRWVELNIVLISWEGRPATLTFLADITERKRAEGALRQSEEKFRQLFDEAPVGYHEYDLQGRITGVNRTELDILGYSRDEMVGKPVWNFIAGEDSQQTVLARITGVIPPGRQFERTYRRKDGTTFPVLIEDRILRDPKEKIIGMRSTIQDITERKRTEEVLKESEKRYRTVIEHSNDGVCIVKGDTHLYANQKFLEMFGYNHPEEVIGKSILILNPA